MDKGFDPFFKEHYEELRGGHFRKKKPRIQTLECDHDKWVCFDLTKNCKQCKHNADLMIKGGFNYG